MSKHHEYEISEHPEVEWALNLLRPDPNHDPGVLKRYISEIVCVGLSVVSVSVGNVLLRMPFYSGIHKHTVAGILGYGVSQVLNKLADNYKAERDTRLRDYIIRHPELFPEPERVKFGQILEPWLPIR